MLLLPDSLYEATSQAIYIPAQPSLVTLPPELILEIASHLPPPCSVPQRSGMDLKEECDCRVRQYSLRALSRTCRSLRRISLDLAWEHVELNKGIKERAASPDCGLGLSHRDGLVDMDVLSHVR